VPPFLPKRKTDVNGDDRERASNNKKRYSNALNLSCNIRELNVRSTSRTRDAHNIRARVGYVLHSKHDKHERGSCHECA